MDVVIETILELLLEGAAEASSNRKLPRALRIILLIVLSLLSIGMIALLFYGIAGIPQLGVKIFLTGIVLLLVLFLCRLIYRFYHR